MKNNREEGKSTYALVTIVVLQALIIVLMLGTRTSVQIQPVLNKEADPLRLALDYDSSVAKFEELVKRNPESMEYRPSLPDGNRGWSVLADCAIVGKTNYVRVLIKYGADVEKAIEDLESVKASDAIRLVQKVAAETAQRDAHPKGK